jgi:hypothetical protein
MVTFSALRTGRFYPLPPEKIPGTHFLFRLSQPQGHSAAGRIMSKKNVHDGWTILWLYCQYFSQFSSQRFVKCPVIFLYGHKTHLTLQLIVLCSECQIVIITFYKNATRILQPADLVVFRPVRLSWEESCEGIVLKAYRRIFKWYDVCTPSERNNLNQLLEHK